MWDRRGSQLRKLTRSVAMGMCGGKARSGQWPSKRCGHKVTISCVNSAPQTHIRELCICWVLWGKVPPIHVCLLPRDDAFSDSLSQKADSEASSGPLLDDKASSKNDLQSPTEHISDYGFGGVMGR